MTATGLCTCKKAPKRKVTIAGPPKKVRKDAKIDYCNLERLVMKVNPFPLSPGIMDCFAICQFLKFSSMSPSFCVKSATRHVAVKGLMFPL